MGITCHRTQRSNVFQGKKKYTVSDHLINQTAGFTQALQRLFVDTWYAPVCASAAHSEGHHMKSSGAGSVM